MASNTAKELTQLLVVERRSLLEGSYDALEDIAQQKARLIERLAFEGPAQDVVTPIKRAMDHNHRLVAAALAGIKNARSRLAALDSVQSGLTTYDQTGALSIRKAVGGQIQKKA